MDTPVIWLFLLVALLIGWILGRNDNNKKFGSKSAPSTPSNVKTRLQLLFDNYSDSAIDKMLSSLEVSSETFDTHISIGKHFRKQGEVEKAILVHQNLMAHPELSQKNSETVIFELAKDYKAAGLFDRAVSLLEQLSESKTYQYDALVLLLGVRERERDWEDAVSVAKKLELKRFPELRLKVAHYLCELAEDKLNDSLVRESEQLFKQSVNTDKNSVRGLLGLAKIAIFRKEYHLAIRYLKQVEETSLEDLYLTFPLFLECTKATNSFNEYRSYLEALYDKTGQMSLIKAIADAVCAENGQSAAFDYLKEIFLLSPNLTILHWMIEYGRQGSIDLSDMSDQVIEVLEGIEGSLNKFLCSACGFSNSQFFWQCPSCKDWQTNKPVLEYQKR